MPVWVHKPRDMVVGFDKRIDARPPFVVRVRDAVTGVPLVGAVGSVVQGSLLSRARTDFIGRATLDLSGATLGPMELTVTRNRYRAYFGKVIQRPAARQAQASAARTGQSAGVSGGRPPRSKTSPQQPRPIPKKAHFTKGIT